MSRELAARQRPQARTWVLVTATLVASCNSSAEQASGKDPSGASSRVETSRPQTSGPDPERHESPTETSSAAGATARAPAQATDLETGREDCGLRARNVDQLVAITDLAEDQAGAFRTVFDRSAEALTVCPGSEPLWYAFARSAELGFGQFPLVLAGSNVGDATAAAELAFGHQPHSQRIAVVEARAHGDVDKARAALALDPSYAPARLALSRALLARNETEEALRLSDSPKVPGGDTLRAQVLLARGEASKAASLARRDLTATWDVAPEPYAMRAVRCAARETLGLALLAQHSRAAKQELRSAVDCGSSRAAQALEANP